MIENENEIIKFLGSFKKDDKEKSKSEEKDNGDDLFLLLAMLLILNPFQSKKDFLMDSMNARISKLEDKFENIKKLLQ